MGKVPKKTITAVRKAKEQLIRALDTNRLKGYQELTLRESLGKIQAWIDHWDKRE